MKKSNKISEKRKREVWQWYDKTMKSLEISKEILKKGELRKIFRKIGVKPVLIGGMAVRLFGDLIVTGDIDFLFSKEDYEKLKKEGRRHGIDIKHNSFIFKGGRIDIVKEGKKGKTGVVPAPDAIRDKGIRPTLEGLVFLELIALRIKDSDYIARLSSKINEATLKDLIDKSGSKDAWNAYQALTGAWNYVRGIKNIDLRKLRKQWDWINKIRSSKQKREKYV